MRLLTICLGTSPDTNSTSPKVGFSQHQGPASRTGRQREVMVVDEGRPTPHTDSSPGDDDLPPADARSNAGDWLERRDDLPQVPSSPSSSRLWLPRNPIQTLRRLHRVQGVPDLTSTDRDLVTVPALQPLPAIELDGLQISIEAPGDARHTQEGTSESQDLPPSRNVDLDEDETALAAAIQLSLRSQNRYTPMGTDLEELRQAFANSLI